MNPWIHAVMISDVNMNLQFRGSCWISADTFKGFSLSFIHVTVHHTHSVYRSLLCSLFVTFVVFDASGCVNVAKHSVFIDHHDHDCCNDECLLAAVLTQGCSNANQTSISVSVQCISIHPIHHTTEIL